MKLKVIFKVVLYLVIISIVILMLFIGYVYFSKPLEPKNTIAPLMMNKLRSRYGRWFERLGKSVEINYLPDIYFDKYSLRWKVKAKFSIYGVNTISKQRNILKTIAAYYAYKNFNNEFEILFFKKSNKPNIGNGERGSTILRKDVINRKTVSNYL